MEYKKGDTLIEVTLAIGIFSMIAIAVVSVMNAGTSGAQSALETTLAREEIDAQAEALRFIQSSYINDKGVIDASENRFQNLWQEIANLAVDPDLKVDADGDGVKDDDIAKFTPKTCQALYNGQYLDDSNAFIINTRYLGDFTAGSSASIKNSSNGDSAIFIKKESNQFYPASTYPRLIFRNNSGDSNLIESISSAASKRLYRAEGIFIVAVKDTDKTAIVDNAGAVSQKSAFYDFYIRSCWYGAGTNTPSTISTVIRLYNPDAVASAHYKFSAAVHGSTSGPSYISDDSVTVSNNVKNFMLPEPTENTKGWNFFYCDQPLVDGVCPAEHSYKPGEIITNSINNNPTFNYYAVWDHIKYTINYDSNGSAWARAPQICYIDGNPYDDNNPEDGCVIERNDITRSGYVFKGWCDGEVINGGVCQGTTYQKGYIIPTPSGFPDNRIITLKAIWAEHNETITIVAEWDTNTDYDSYMKLQLPGTNSYRDANWGTRNIDVTYNNQTYSLITGNGDGRGGINGIYYEKFVINTLGGKSYYYSLRNWSTPGNIGAGIKITVSGQYFPTKVFTSTPKTNCLYWNVFAYLDGSIVERNTCTSSMEYGYGYD
ncbi:hypothetical protein IJH23_03230 [Candidatus Saccharibacteria bacterium]|nr:hypothetical protein [Candidatus Saccharibacteria bacterium]